MKWQGGGIAYLGQRLELLEYESALPRWGSVIAPGLKWQSGGIAYLGQIYSVYSFLSGESLFLVDKTVFSNFKKVFGSNSSQNQEFIEIWCPYPQTEAFIVWLTNKLIEAKVQNVKSYLWAYLPDKIQVVVEIKEPF